MHERYHPRDLGPLGGPCRALNGLNGIDGPAAFDPEW